MKTTSMKYNRTIRLSLLTGILIFGLGPMYVSAGDLTTDNLTVNGNLTVKDLGAGSAPTNGLVFYYSFNTDTTPVPDESGNGNTGTVYGATWVTNGITGGAYSFDGSDDYISIADSTSIKTFSSITISLWVYRIGSSGWQHVLGKGSGDDYTFTATGYGTTFYYDFKDTDSADISCYSSSPTISANTWHHIVILYDGTSNSDAGRFYIDNSLATSSAGTGKSLKETTGTFIIGARGGDADSPFNGKIDEVRIYNRALTAAEIRGLYYNDAHLTAGAITLEVGVKYLKPLGDVGMGIYTNSP